MKHLIKNKYWNLNEDYNKEKLLYLLIDRSDHVDIYNNFYWYNDKEQFHREYDLPSYIWYYGDVCWHKNDQFHRENNKPAGISINGKKEYWLDNKKIKIIK